jgi:hypothetical protein
VKIAAFLALSNTLLGVEWKSIARPSSLAVAPIPGPQAPGSPIQFSKEAFAYCSSLTDVDFHVGRIGALEGPRESEEAAK